jgi:hypothetical protein
MTLHFPWEILQTARPEGLACCARASGAPSRILCDLVLIRAVVKFFMVTQNSNRFMNRRAGV